MLKLNKLADKIGELIYNEMIDTYTWMWNNRRELLLTAVVTYVVFTSIKNSHNIIYDAIEDIHSE